MTNDCVARVSFVGALTMSVRCLFIVNTCWHVTGVLRQLFDICTFAGSLLIRTDIPSTTFLVQRKDFDGNIVELLFFL